LQTSIDAAAIDCMGSANKTTTAAKALMRLDTIKSIALPERI